ncbi:Metalloenzyme, LuxS/M16 peptidase-like protein [Entophlyctis helioformis]|nr:Metalloenzyme, LuxS/M16 peptidase-like protein [Entophlyctis helioformis]
MSFIGTGVGVGVGVGAGGAADLGVGVAKLAGAPWTLFPGAVRKPDNDERTYAVLTLPNRLQAVVVSDPTTDKASAALDVHVGHLCDPADVAGLAHFCEHLCECWLRACGTEKYPVENAYSQFLSEHGGYSNAFTSAEDTNYYFEVAADHLEGAMDRFAQFFISPLFSESCTERELNAVDSEHKKNLQSDDWRNYQLFKDLCNPSHPYNKFGTGNLETLKDIPLSKDLDLRRILLDFHDQYYSANIMKVAVIGKEPISQLIDWVVSKFSPIKDKDTPVPVFSNDALTAAELGKEIRIKPVKESRMLSITFPFPDTREQYKTQPAQYLSHLLGHEGHGSVLSLLKKKGWAQGLYAGPSTGARGFDFFNVSVELTVSGLEHFEEVLVILFQYIALIKQSPIEEWIFHEYQTMNEISFRFKEKSSPATYMSHLAGNMHNYEAQDIVSGPYLIEKFDRAAIQACLDFLRADAFRYTLVAPSFDTTGWKQGPHYGTPYTKLAHIQPHPELHIPKANTFIPEDFSVHRIDVAKPATHPLIIQETPLIRMWPTHFFMLSTPLAYDSPMSCVLTRLYTDLLKDALNEFSYYASLAGLEYRLDNAVDGMELSIHGYNDKMHILLETIVAKMKSFVVEASQFERIKEQLLKQYVNFDMESPHSHAIFYVTLMTQQRLFTNAQKIDALSRITIEDVQAFFPRLMARLHVEALVHGNVARERAIEYGAIILRGFGSSELPESERYGSMRTHMVPQGASIIMTRNVPNAENLNSAIEYCLQIGDAADQDIRTHLGLLAQIGVEPAFDQLRTKEQLGYMVFSGIRAQTGLLSSERDPAFLESRIDAFLLKFETMPDETYAKHQAAYRRSLYWGHINHHYYDFEQSQNDAEKIPSITKDSLIAFFRKYIAPSSTVRRHLRVHMRSQKNGMTTGPEGEAVLNAPGVVLVGEDTDIAEFKAKFELSSPAKPVKPIETWLAV